MTRFFTMAQVQKSPNGIHSLDDLHEKTAIFSMEAIFEHIQHIFRWEALLKRLPIIQHFYKIYDSFYTDKKVELVAKTCERNNVLKTLLSNILLQDSNLANFLLINITNEIIIEFFNYKDNVGFHGVTLRLGLYFAD